MKARLNFSLKRVSVEPYRSKLTTNAADRVEVNSKLKLECSTLVTDPDGEEVRQMFSTSVSTGVVVKITLCGWRPQLYFEPCRDPMSCMLLSCHHLQRQGVVDTKAVPPLLKIGSYQRLSLLSLG